jgi:autotransporter-associated beta strand protein
MLAAIRCSLMFLVSATAYAGSAQWNLNPMSGDWNTAANWTPTTVPNGPADIATFDLSNTTDVSISASTEVDAATFPSAANPYIIAANPGFTLTISGTGIVNSSGITQNFLTAVDGTGNFGQIFFTNSATAGTFIIFINNGSAADFARGGETAFFDTSTAANGTFVNEGSTGPRSGGATTEFYDSSTAGNANFINKDGIGTSTSATIFHNTSTAANGIFTNNGAGTPGPIFAEGGQTIFFDTSTAANGTFTDNGTTVNGGFGGATVFDYSSSAANGTFTNNGGTPSGAAALGGGNTIFLKTSTAANGTFVNNAATTSDGEAGVTEFGIFPSANADSPTAAFGTFINNGATVSGAAGGKTAFYETSSADSATLIANSGIGGGEGGQIVFNERSKGGIARIELFGNGSLDASGHKPPGVTIGSIEGEGGIFLGSKNLIVGANNLSTTFSGMIQDGGFGGYPTKIPIEIFDFAGPGVEMYARITTVNSGVLWAYDSILDNSFAIEDGGFGGSLTKIGKGKLVLSGQNIYSGGTAIKGGALVINNTTGSGTGSGPVEVSAGQLGGSGIIGGDVTVGNGGRRRGTLSPGDSEHRCDTLTIQSTLTFQSDAIYTFDLNSRTAQSDSVVANGVTIDSGAQFSFSDIGHCRLPIGTVFIAVEDISANPIAGTFSNLPDQSTFTIKGNTYQVSYQGGDGNDLTLTIVR